jgi:predicted small secreted protein
MVNHAPAGHPVLASPASRNQIGGTNMITPFKRIVVPLCILVLLALVGLGCRTAHGFGQDMEKAGEKIQDGTN